ncbi:MAG: DUF72 domain-containing protein [Clostridiaceae bacterium]|nr:DUF72 domain-containing protein [Clostridiaceae bacterium]
MIKVGTAGYSYADWVGPFYPQGTKPAEMLEYYSLYFSFVEVNSTYYHMPGLKLFEGLNRKTPDDFQFAVKLFGGFTHERNCGREEAEKFKYSLSPIIQSGKLSCILAQFPYSFHCNSAGYDYLKRLREHFPEQELCIEFRNREWIRKEVFDLLRKEDMGYVCVDEPGIRGLIGNVTAVTSRMAYLRLHGRNGEKWYSGEGAERYDYLYSGSELLEWVNRLREMDDESGITLVSFNNHPKGKAIENAKALMGYLGQV